MKMCTILMTFVAFAGVFFVHASDLGTDFEQIPADTNIIVETSGKATRGIDWQIEIANQSSDWAYITIIQDGALVLSGKNEPIATRDNSQYFTLYSGRVVRVAGLDSDKEVELRVFSSDQYRELIDPHPFFPKTRGVIFQELKDANRIRKGVIGANATAYMVIDKAFNLEPVKKSIFRRTTDSGLPLDKNIKE